MLRSLIFDVLATARDLKPFIAFNNTIWKELVASKKLRKALVHPRYEYADWPKLELVFRTQPPGSVELGKDAIRCCLPDVRRFGLSDIYYRTGKTY